MNAVCTTAVVPPVRKKTLFYLPEVTIGLHHCTALAKIYQFAMAAATNLSNSRMTPSASESQNIDSPKPQLTDPSWC